MRYQHTQVGYWMAGAMVGLAAIIALRVQSLTIFGVMCLVTTLASALFGTLTVIVDETSVHVRFGPVSLLRERIAVADVTHARVVRNSPLYGWGMRYIPHGRLWNVWGLDAVELQLRNGTRFRIGTNEPQELLQALRARGISA
ncbi:MAG: hypothetical protein JNL48_14045 [Acidobacteria bacterium]|nr:hypothetical protein [Acidobacteriota bacterium]